MEYRTFGTTGFDVSVVGFGAWAIGGPATAGRIPIGWGRADDETSVAALRRAVECGITFFDTADVYGLGHSEELLGRVLGNRPDVIVATKGGQRPGPDGSLVGDYSAAHLRAACDASLRRLRRDTIDFYQLHTARVPDLVRGECIETMEALKTEGKLRAWGVSMATFRPGPEAELLMERGIGQGVQLVLNVVNQRAAALAGRLAGRGFGVIARMALQFGLLSDAVTPQTRFDPTDHRSFRLAPQVLNAALPALEAHVWPLARALGMSKAELALSFAASVPGVCTVIPGIRTPAQAERNATAVRRLNDADVQTLLDAAGRLEGAMSAVERAG